MTPRIKKWIIRPFLITLVSLVTLVIFGIGVLMIEQEELVNLALNKVNKGLKGELTIESSKISLFKHFPSVGVALHKARFYADKSKDGEPLFRFEKLYVSVSVADLLNDKYNVRRLSFHDGQLDLVRETDGTFNVLEALNIHSDTTTASSSDSTLEIDLHKISIKGVNVSYLDKSSNRRLATSIEELTSSFTSDSSLMTVSVVSDMVLDMTSPADTMLFRRKKFHADITADYLVHKKLLEISVGSFKLQDASFNVEGTADLSDQSNVNFRIKGDKPDFNLLVAFLPGDVKAALKPFRYDGKISFDGIVKGAISNNRLPFIEVNFGCEDGWFLNEGADRKVDQLAFKGYYTNGPERSLCSSELHMMNVHARPGKGIFKGNFMIRDFHEPKILMQLQSDLELEFIGHFFGIKDLHAFAGKIKLDMDFKEIMDIELPEESLGKLQEGVQSKLTVENLSFRIPGYPHEIRNMNLHAEMKEGKVTLDSATLRVGGSDLRLSGGISDIRRFIRNYDQPVSLTLNASSNKAILKELLAYDTALSNHVDEEIHKFNIGLLLETSVAQLLHPAPLPQGKFEVKNLRASFKKYPHSFKDLGATVRITDTTLILRNFSGMIDESDIKFSGRLRNYKLWFDDIMTGKAEVAFDFKSKRFAFDDILAKGYRKFIPRGYRHEELNDLWLRAKVELKYDTVFRFAKAQIANITGQLKQHNINVKDVTGKVRYGANRILILDTLKGMVGKSDFEVSMRAFNGESKRVKKRTNYFHFKSENLDLNEIASYDFSEPPRKKRNPDSTAVRKRKKPDSTAIAAVRKDTSSHAKAFNIFTLPFSDFNVWLDVGKLKFNKLGIRGFTARIRMTEDHILHVDTVAMKIAGGTVGLTGQLNGSDTSKLFFSSTMKVDQVDLEKVGVKLDHFGQDIVINKNVKGRLTGQIISNLQVHPNLIPLVDNSTASFQIKIYDGTLVDFAPLQALAGYFKDKNLRLVRFDSLKNELSFAKGVLTIPLMNINSSLGYIEMSGKQWLDLNMDYDVRIPVKMVTQVGINTLLVRKNEDVDANQIDEIEAAGKDRKMRFVNLKVTGKPDDFKVSLGKSKTGG